MGSIKKRRIFFIVVFVILYGVSDLSSAYISMELMPVEKEVHLQFFREISSEIIYENVMIDLDTVITAHAVENGEMVEIQYKPGMKIFINKTIIFYEDYGVILKSGSEDILSVMIWGSRDQAYALAKKEYSLETLIRDFSEIVLIVEDKEEFTIDLGVKGLLVETINHITFAKEEFIINITAEEKDLIDINYASADELKGLWGVGPATAETIIKYREEHGLFQRTEEIMDVSGIGIAKFEKWDENISLSIRIKVDK